MLLHRYILLIYKKKSYCGRAMIMILRTGASDGDPLWTDRCNTRNEWQAWKIKMVNGQWNQFHLVHSTTGRCVKPASSDSHSHVISVACTIDDSMIWS